MLSHASSRNVTSAQDTDCRPSGPAFTCTQLAAAVRRVTEALLKSLEAPCRIAAYHCLSAVAADKNVSEYFSMDMDGPDLHTLH